MSLTACIPTCAFHTISMRVSFCYSHLHTLTTGYKADAIGAVKPGDSFCYVEEVTNEAGVWAKLSADSLQQLGCSAPQGYTLAYSAEKKQQYLFEKEVCHTCT